MRNVYALHWHNKRIQYGFTNYDRSLIAELTKIKKDGKVLEVAIGDGEPYAKDMLLRGYDIYGVDIAPRLIKLVQNSLPEVKASLGDAENLEFPDNYFDITYCFRSTWYFPDVKKAIKEMIRTTKSGGGIIFDLQNKKHPLHIKAMKKRTWSKDHYILSTLTKYFKTTIKVLIRPIKHFPTDLSSTILIHETPSDVPSILSMLSSNVRSIKIYGIDWSDVFPLKSIRAINMNNFDRIVLKIIK